MNHYERQSWRHSVDRGQQGEERANPSFIVVHVAQPIFRLPNPLDLFQAYYQIFNQRSIQLGDQFIELNWHYLGGSVSIANNILPHPEGNANSPIAVTHQLRLNQSLLPLWQKIQNPGEYCILVGVATCFQVVPSCYNLQKSSLTRVVAYLRSKHIAGLFRQTQQGVYYFGHLFAPTTFSQRIIHEYDPNLSFYLRNQPYLIAILTGTSSHDVNYLTGEFQYKPTDIPRNVILAEF